DNNDGDVCRSDGWESRSGGDKLVSWSSKKQDCTLMYSAESEYVSLFACCAQVLWMRTQLTDYGFHFDKIPMYCDSKAAIAISCNPVQHSCTKHIDVRYHFIKEKVKKGIVELLFVGMEYQLADLFTKALPVERYQSTARIKTTEEGTKILATVDGKLRTVSESSIRRNIKLNDEAGISSLPNAELFENLQLMGYNILPNQKFTFQKGQFSHQWKYRIHTIMQCLSPKSIGFNEFSSNIATALAQQTSPTTYSSPSLPPVTNEPLPTVTPSDNPPLRQYTRRAKTAQSSALPPVADELASPIGDDSQEMASKIEAQELEITNLKASVKLLEDIEAGGIAQSRDDASIKGKSLDEGEEAPKKGSDDIAEMVTILTSLDAATVLSSGVAKVSTGSGSIPTYGPIATRVPTGSEVVPTASLIFTTTTESTPYTRRKGKETMVESETPKKKKVQEQIDVQLARELEEEMARDAQRMNE
nr:retrovirus-related Pol polyprotein from transposon TNT 1-94 [Tanacetum cinerariifolium]